MNNLLQQYQTHPTPGEQNIPCVGNSFTPGMNIKTETEIAGTEDLFPESLFPKSNIKQQNSNNKKTITNSNLDIKISPINHNDSLSNLTASNNENIPHMTLAVNTAGFAAAKAAINQPAAKSVNNPDKTLVQESENNLINSNIS